MKRAWRGFLRTICEKIREVVTWADRHLPPGIRTLAGIALMVGGVFGFLPILGFWMIPAGAVLVALDIPQARGWVLRRLSRGCGN